MRKIILGLLLTASLPAISFAKPSVEEVKVDFLLDSDLKNIGKDIEFQEMLDCYHGYFLRTKDCDGSVSTVNAGGNSGGCGGEQDGTIIMHVKVQNVCTPEAQASMFLQQMSNDFFTF
ncbi:hypothetical protein [Elizabethkingia meningoseptica]|uniref:hypothetical protein n=1 Tax=Elizabethkingia meningoseptica TaxID=238 RepID=UPI0038925BBC